MKAIEKFMPFDYDETAEDPTLYEYSALDEREFNSSYLTNGVFPQTRLITQGNLTGTAYLGGSLAVTAGALLSVNVSPGIAMIEGVKYCLKETKTIQFPTSSTVAIYDIVIEVNWVTQNVVCKYQPRQTGRVFVVDYLETKCFISYASQQ